MAKKAKARVTRRAPRKSAKAAKKASRARKAAKKTARKSAQSAAKGSKRAAKKVARKAAKTAAKKQGAKKQGAKKQAAKKTAARKAPARKAPSGKTAARKSAAKKAPASTPTSPAARQARKAAQARTASVISRRPNLDRERRTIREEEEEMVPSPPSSLNMDRTASAARTGRAEYEQRLRNHTSTGPAMTGGDIDADWEDAESVGDEAPGGDNPTPDQDVVDEIGRAIGIEYEDDEELQGGDEVAERDRHRWELDPASKEDFEEE